MGTNHLRKVDEISPVFRYFRSFNSRFFSETVRDVITENLRSILIAALIGTLFGVTYYYFPSIKHWLLQVNLNWAQAEIDNLQKVIDGLFSRQEFLHKQVSVPIDEMARISEELKHIGFRIDAEVNNLERLHNAYSKLNFEFTKFSESLKTSQQNRAPNTFAIVVAVGVFSFAILRFSVGSQK